MKIYKGITYIDKLRCKSLYDRHTWNRTLTKDDCIKLNIYVCTKETNNFE